VSNRKTEAFRSLVVPAVCLLGLIAQRAAAEPTIVAPTEPVPIGGFADVTITGLENKDQLAWVTVPEIPVRVYAVWGSGDPILSVPTNRSGTWTLVLSFIEDDKPVLKKVLLTIGQPGPGPTPGPTPIPTPDPSPVPPGPTGLRVLILEETESRQALSRDQLLILTSPEIRAYLNEKAPDRWRILDDDIQATGMVGWSQEWMDAYKQGKELSGGQVPFIMVSNGREGAAVKLPATVAETLTLLKRFGG
jgi:hypothetical protein